MNTSDAPSPLTGTWLMNQVFPPMNWMVTGLIPEGFGVLAASPKIGKSWLVLDIGLAIAEGQPVFGVPTDKRPVLYLA
ncbi:AAA family ATPase [Mycobacterium sp. D16R24]|uniref:AAA family ATPase n=1 Tax=Mycobacterium sp. D16R24 TaxID=1855656 RepID=UPI000993F81B|nr:AAA family ATPase [Mycobacterium sp. D16R24]